MNDFESWASHYCYDPTTDAARDDYAEYRRTAAQMNAIFSLDSNPSETS